MTSSGRRLEWDNIMMIILLQKMCVVFTCVSEKTNNIKNNFNDTKKSNNNIPEVGFTSYMFLITIQFITSA